MSIDFPPGLRNFIAMTPDTDRLPAPVIWQKNEIKGGALYKSMDMTPESNGLVSAFLEKYAEDPDLLSDMGKELHDDQNSQVVRLGEYAVKIFKFKPGGSTWERERRAGLSAIRTAVMIESGLLLLNKDRPISVMAPKLHTCFQPESTDESPIWIMKYEPSDIEPRIMTPDMIKRFQTILNMALIEVGGERFVETIDFGNDPCNWRVQRHEEGAKLIKFGCAIKSDWTSEMVWRREASLFRV